MERAARLMELVAKLPRQYQHISTLKFFEDLTLEEMSEVLGQSKKTVAMRFSADSRR